MNIVLDTNIWIFLINPKETKLFEKFKELKKNNEINVIINDVILKEWYRNKQNALKFLMKNIEADFSYMSKIKESLDKNLSQEVLLSLQKKKDERIKNIKKRAKEIEKFMKNCTIINTTDAQKLFIANLAIDKKPPLNENNKNNFNDALILRNVCEYVNKNTPYLYDLIFVTDNTQDFIDKNTNEIFPDILEGLMPIKIKTLKQLGEALKLAPEFMEGWEEWFDNEMYSQIMYEFELSRGK